MLIRELLHEKCEPVLLTPGMHVLVVAEAGFSMLDQYARFSCGLSVEDIQRFADRVNRFDEAGTLHPVAPISAVPRAYLRGESSPDGVGRHVAEFLAANAASIRAKGVVIDLRVSSSRVPAAAVEACRRALEAGPDGIEEAVLLL